MSATVEEYHPEVVKFVDAFADRIRASNGVDLFYRELRELTSDYVTARSPRECSSRRDYLIQFLLSECAKPLPKSEGVQ